MVIRTRVHGPNHPNTLAARSNLALVFQAQGRLAEAERMLRDVVNDNRALHGDDHPHTLAGLHRVAVVLGARGDVAQARSMFEHVLAGRQRLLGVDHPDTLSTRTALDTLPAQ
jgi:tetratricopeptide (TPR) repeat protein